MRNTQDALLWATAGAGLYLAINSTLRASRRIDLRGRSVLISGGSRGLGLVMARQLAEQGARLAICARDGEELDRARADLKGDVLAVRCDIRERDQVERMAGEVTGHFGGLDVLINDAGIITVGPMEEMTQEDYEDAMRTHYWGPLWTIQAFLPAMRKKGEGRILNVTSIGGKVSVPHLLPYSGSKFALVGLSQGLRAELLKDGIYVTTAVPGLMRTGSPRNAMFKGQHRAEYAWFALGDSLPGLSVSAETASSQMLDAMRHGDAEVIVSLPAKLGVLAANLFPNVTADLLALVNRFLPGPGGIGEETRKGKESGSAVTPSVLTSLTEKAARQNNEVPPEEAELQKAGAIP